MSPYRRILKRSPFTLVAADGALVLAAIVGAAAIRFGGLDMERLIQEKVPQKGAVFAAIAVLCLYYWDFYDRYHALSRRQTTTNALEAIGCATIGLAMITYAAPPLTIGRGILLIGAPLTVALLVGSRLAAFALRRAGEFQERVLVLGTGATARRIAREVIARPHLGLRIHGFIDDDPAMQGVSIVNPRVCGTSTELPKLVKDEGIGRVVVALDERRGRLPMGTLLALKIGGTIVHDAASLYEAVTGKILVEYLRPSWIVFSDGFRPSRTTRLLKRVCDFVLAAAGLAVAGPLLMLPIALAIRLDSRGPALFRQERVGEGGRPFPLYKFRSMRLDAEAASGPVWAAANDPRVTRVGAWLRKLRLDELPQLWNVLCGDMSFVGPRPERPHFVERLQAQIPYYAQRHAVKPGVTGWAQVRHPYGNTVADAAEKLQYDLYYIKNMSLALDLTIVLQTVKVVLLGRGAL